MQPVSVGDDLFFLGAYGQFIVYHVAVEKVMAKTLRMVGTPHQRWDRIGANEHGAVASHWNDTAYATESQVWDAAERVQLNVIDRLRSDERRAQKRIEEIKEARRAS